MNYDATELLNNAAIHNLELMVDGYRSFLTISKKGISYTSFILI